MFFYFFEKHREYINIFQKQFSKNIKVTFSVFWKIGTTHWMPMTPVEDYDLQFFWLGVMVAWTGLEHFRVGRYDPPPPANEPEDYVVCFLIWFLIMIDFWEYCFIQITVLVWARKQNHSPYLLSQSVWFAAKVATGGGIFWRKKWSKVLKNSPDSSISYISNPSFNATTAIACSSMQLSFPVSDRQTCVFFQKW